MFRVSRTAASLLAGGAAFTLGTVAAKPREAVPADGDIVYRPRHDMGGGIPKFDPADPKVLAIMIGGTAAIASFLFLSTRTSNRMKKVGGCLERGMWRQD